MDISTNPPVVFQQKDLDTCAFSSLSSALFYMGFTEEALQLHSFGQDWTINNEKYVEKTLESIVQFIPKSSTFNYFRSRYTPHKIKNKYNIFEKVRENEIRLIVLIMSDNTENHAVTVVNNFIFDANCTNALPLSLEGLDCCCGVDANYVGVSRGYHWKFTK
jgi:hypothetical protein